MEPKHLAPITRTTGVNDPDEIQDRLSALPGATFTVVSPDGQRLHGIRDGNGAGWVVADGDVVARPLETVPVPYLISYPIAPAAAPQDPVVVRAGVLSTEAERATYAERFVDPDGEEFGGQQAMAVDGAGVHYRLLYDWGSGELIADSAVTFPGGGGGGDGPFLGLVLPITVVEID